MKLFLEINNLSGAPFSFNFFQKIAERTFFLSNVPTGKKEVSVSLALVGEEEIKRLNFSYRGKKATTDVLSFVEFSSQKKIREAGDKKIFLGEVVLCYNDIKRYAEKNKLEVEKEMAVAFSHGLLHLLGFRHGKKMFALQKEAA